MHFLSMFRLVSLLSVISDVFLLLSVRSLHFVSCAKGKETQTQHDEMKIECIVWREKYPYTSRSHMCTLNSVKICVAKRDKHQLI